MKYLHRNDAASSGVVVVLRLAAILLTMPLFLCPVSGQDGSECQPYQWGFAGLRMQQDGLPTEGTPTNVVVGEINCRYWTTTPAEVNYYTCSEMSLRYEISTKVLFSLNPGLAQDCSNVQAETAYCVRGCKCSLPPSLPPRPCQTDKTPRRGPCPVLSCLVAVDRGKR
jgi:hypothetical protein